MIIPKKLFQCGGILPLSVTLRLATAPRFNRDSALWLEVQYTSNIISVLLCFELNVCMIGTTFCTAYSSNVREVFGDSEFTKAEPSIMRTSDSGFLSNATTRDSMTDIN